MAVVRCVLGASLQERSGQAQAWSVQNAHICFPCGPCVLLYSAFFVWLGFLGFYTKSSLPLQAFGHRSLPIRNQDFDITHPHKNLFYPCASRYAILILLLFGRGPRSAVSSRSLCFLTENLMSRILASFGEPLQRSTP